MKEMIIEALPVIGALLIPYIGWASHKVLMFGFDYLDDKVQGKWLNKAVEFSRQGVMFAHQTIIQDLQRKAQDGKLTKDEWVEGTKSAKRAALVKFRNSISSAPKAVAKMLDSKAEEMIESALVDIKAEGRMVGPVMDPLKGQVSK